MCAFVVEYLLRNLRCCIAKVEYLFFFCCRIFVVESFVVEPIVVESSSLIFLLWNICVFAVESLLWNLRCYILVVDDLCFCCGIIVVESSSLDSCCGLFVLLLWSICC